MTKQQQPDPKYLKYFEYGKQFVPSGATDFQLLLRGEESFGHYDMEKYTKIDAYPRETSFSSDIGAVGCVFMRHMANKDAPTEYVFAQKQRRKEGEFMQRHDPDAKPRTNREFNHVRYTIFSKDQIDTFFQTQQFFFVNVLEDAKKTSPPNAQKKKYQLRDYENLGGLEQRQLNQKIFSIDAVKKAPDNVYKVARAIANDLAIAFFQLKDRSSSQMVRTNLSPMAVIVDDLLGVRANEVDSNEGRALETKLRVLHLVQHWIYPLLGPITWAIDFTSSLRLNLFILERDEAGLDAIQGLHRVHISQLLSRQYKENDYVAQIETLAVDDLHNSLLQDLFRQNTLDLQLAIQLYHILRDAKNYPHRAHVVGAVNNLLGRLPETLQTRLLDCLIPEKEYQQFLSAADFPVEGKQYLIETILKQSGNDLNIFFSYFYSLSSQDQALAWADTALKQCIQATTFSETADIRSQYFEQFWTTLLKVRGGASIQAVTLRYGKSQSAVAGVQFKSDGTLSCDPFDCFLNENQAQRAAVLKSIQTTGGIVSTNIFSNLYAHIAETQDWGSLCWVSRIDQGRNLYSFLPALGRMNLGVADISVEIFSDIWATAKHLASTRNDVDFQNTGLLKLIANNQQFAPVRNQLRAQAIRLAPTDVQLSFKWFISELIHLPTSQRGEFEKDYLALVGALASNTNWNGVEPEFQYLFANGKPENLTLRLATARYQLAFEPIWTLWCKNPECKDFITIQNVQAEIDLLSQQTAEADKRDISKMLGLLTKQNHPVLLELTSDYALRWLQNTSPEIETQVYGAGNLQALLMQSIKVPMPEFVEYFYNKILFPSRKAGQIRLSRVLEWGAFWLKRLNETNIPIKKNSPTIFKLVETTKLIQSLTRNQFGASNGGQIDAFLRIIGKIDTWQTLTIQDENQHVLIAEYIRAWLTPTPLAADIPQYLEGFLALYGLRPDILRTIANSRKVKLLETLHEIALKSPTYAQHAEEIRKISPAILRAYQSQHAAQSKPNNEPAKLHNFAVNALKSPNPSGQNPVKNANQQPAPVASVQNFAAQGAQLRKADEQQAGEKAQQPNPQQAPQLTSFAAQGAKIRQAEASQQSEEAVEQPLQQQVQDFAEQSQRQVSNQPTANQNIDFSKQSQATVASPHPTLPPASEGGSAQSSGLAGQIDFSQEMDPVDQMHYWQGKSGNKKPEKKKGFLGRFRKKK